MNADKHGFRKRKTFIIIFVFTLILLRLPLLALEPWEKALAGMPLRTNVTELTKTNAIPLMLASLQENQTVKALIFMPGATDEFYFFHRGYAKLTNASPTLFDAIIALTNQTLIRATFRSPFVLVHTAEDPLEPLYKIEHAQTAERIRSKKFVQHAHFNDVDWDYLLPILSFRLDTKFYPEEFTNDSWHFFRHSFAGWNLNGWEALEAVSMAGKTTFTIRKKKIIFEGDLRFRSRPPVPKLP